jgi:tetratricopeptide (TPR) repeat protein
MSEETSEASAIPCCASCGIKEVDNDIKLKDCDGCDLLYCSDYCRQKLEHAEDCKTRAAQLVRDELLFKIPESSHLGDCPICCVPLPLDVEISMMSCCSKIICKGCCHADAMREREASMTPSCPFCREPVPGTQEELDKQKMKRVEANDPVAICFEGGIQYDKGDYRSAFECFTKAAELGDAGAHNQLAGMYHNRHYVEKNEGKFVHHMEEAAILGHPIARRNLGAYEWDNNYDYDRAVKHWGIAATQGQDDAIKKLMKAYRDPGCVTHEGLTAALRAHKAAVDATKSPQRKAAEEYYRKIEE